MRYSVIQCDDNDQFYVLRDEQHVVSGPFGDRIYAERAAYDLSVTRPDTIAADIEAAKRDAGIAS